MEGLLSIWPTPSSYCTKCTASSVLLSAIPHYVAILRNLYCFFLYGTLDKVGSKPRLSLCKIVVGAEGKGTI